MNTSDPIGRSANSRATSAARSESLLVGQEGRDRADRHADRGEQNDRGDPQPLGDRLAQRHQDEQRRKDGEDGDDVLQGAPASRLGAGFNGERARALSRRRLRLVNGARQSADRESVRP